MDTSVDVERNAAINTIAVEPDNDEECSSHVEETKHNVEEIKNIVSCINNNTIHDTSLHTVSVDEDAHCVTSATKNIEEQQQKGK